MRSVKTACCGIGTAGLTRSHENVGLRLAMQRRVPLIYFYGIVPGLYVAEWPVYIVGDEPDLLPFTVSVDDRRFASLGSVDQPESEETEIRRRYATRVFQQRLHQREFRERVVRACQHHCAICRLRRDELLDAAHIVPDGRASTLCSRCASTDVGHRLAGGMMPFIRR